MDKQFTASEVMTLEQVSSGIGNALTDSRGLTPQALSEWAVAIDAAVAARDSLLEAREKTVPVRQFRVVPKGSTWTDVKDDEIWTAVTAHPESYETRVLYAHSAQAQPPAASVTSANADMYWLDSDPEHLSFEDIPSALEYVEGDDITTVTLQRARKLSDITVPVRFNNECGNYEIDEAALAAQENPNG